jgi:adenosylcobinamide-phosphate synthase
MPAVSNPPLNPMIDFWQRADIVSRDTAAMRPKMSACGSESVLENGNDAVFAALFCLPWRRAGRAATGWPIRWMRCGATARRALAISGAAARLDDVLNIPARLHRFTYALLVTPPSP